MGFYLGESGFQTLMPRPEGSDPPLHGFVTTPDHRYELQAKLWTPEDGEELLIVKVFRDWGNAATWSHVAFDTDGGIVATGRHRLEKKSWRQAREQLLATGRYELSDHRQPATRSARGER